MEFVFFWFVFMAVVGWWASEWNRSIIGFMLLAFFLSPIIAGIALLVKGKNLEIDRR